MQPTESVLHDWRYGQTQAERLCAAIMHLDGFQAVDPQHPTGGPDGTKDILAIREGSRWVGAAYFPTTDKTFAEIRRKFTDDFAGVVRNTAAGFAFFVNQRLSVAEREDLISVADPIKTELYHLERIVSIMDAPKGCGLRLQYLRIPMSEEEQWAFWSEMNHDVVRKLVQNESALQNISTKLDLVLARTNALVSDFRESPSSVLGPVETPDSGETPTASLSVSMLSWVHRVVTEGSKTPESSRGRLRAVGVWIGPPGSGRDQANFVPPDDFVRPLIELLNWWKSEYSSLRQRKKLEILAALARFHHGFLALHPFLDANGRVARVLLDQSARELLNSGVGPELVSDPSAYYKCLQEADKGDLRPLIKLIEASLR